jgi:hypothetical protein
VFGLLIYEREFLHDLARIICRMRVDEVRKKGPRYFPPNSTDRRIEWIQENPRLCLVRAQKLSRTRGISLSHFNDAVRNDSVGKSISLPLSLLVSVD